MEVRRINEHLVEVRLTILADYDDSPGNAWDAVILILSNQQLKRLRAALGKVAP